jgi:hypothetical protein
LTSRISFQLLVFADAGIVDEDVEAPQLLRGTVHEVQACGLGTNVSMRKGDLGAGCLELGRHALAALTVPVAECHARALGNETPDRRLPDPRCPARHRCNLAVEPTDVRHLSLHCERASTIAPRRHSVIPQLEIDMRHARTMSAVARAAWNGSPRRCVKLTWMIQ